MCDLEQAQSGKFETVPASPDVFDPKEERDYEFAISHSVDYRDKEIE
jgi:hypothetical protein